MTSARGVIAFDLDGTLIPDTTVCIHLAPWVGHDELPELERQYDAGTITNIEVAERDAAFYKNRARADVWAQLESVNVIDGLAETTAWTRAAGLIPVIATVTWKGAAEFFAHRYGFAGASGCEMAEDDGVLLGHVARHFSAEDKVTFVTEVANTRGIAPERIIAVGDSTSDIPLFRAAGLSVALNASDNAKREADVTIETEDLRDVIPTITTYLDDIGT